MTRMNSATEMSSSAASRQAAVLQESLHQRLASYAMAAGAAGVGLLALAPPAKADIIRVSVGVAINDYYELVVTQDSTGAPVGIFDFMKLAGSGSASRNFFAWAKNRVGAAFSNTQLLIGPLPGGYRVGPGDDFVQSGTFNGYRFVIYRGCCGSTRSRRTWGPWDNHPGYLGLRFNVDGETHYGWAYLYPTQLYYPGPTMVLDSYAYETVANKAIDVPVPEPGTLGLLGLGWLGLGFWRRRKQEAANRE